MSTGALFHDEITEPTGVGMSLLMLLERVLARRWCFLLLMKATNFLHRAMCAVSYRHIATAIEMTSKGGGAYCLSLCWLSPWWPPGQYGAISCPMAATSDFWWSPGHAALGDVPCIASVQRHGHWNCPRRRCICSPPPPISIAVIVADGHVMVH